MALTEKYGLSQKLCSTVQSSLRKCIDRIGLVCVSPDIPVDRYYPLQLSCDALATGSVKVSPVRMRAYQYGHTDSGLLRVPVM